MPTTDTPNAKTVAEDFASINKAKDVRHAFSDIDKMLSQKPDENSRKAALQELSSVDLQKLGLPDYHITGYDKKHGLTVADKSNHERTIDAHGNETYKGADGKTVHERFHAPKATTPQADAIPLQFGANGRHMDLQPDGKSGKYQVKDNDSLWSISSDLLGKNNKKLSNQDIEDIKKEINSLAKDNKITDPNKILNGKTLDIQVPENQKPAADKALADKAAKDQADAAKKQQEENDKQKARLDQEQKEKDAKLAASAYHPDTDAANMKPGDDGVYNALAPKGLVEGTPGQAINSTTDGIASRTVTDNNDKDSEGNSTRTTKVKLNDGTIAYYDSTYTSTDTLDANGGLKHRDLKFDYGYADMTFKGSDGQPVTVARVNSIVTDRQADGTYVTTVTGADNQPHQIVTDLTPQPAK